MPSSMLGLRIDWLPYRPSLAIVFLNFLETIEMSVNPLNGL